MHEKTECRPLSIKNHQKVLGIDHLSCRYEDRFNYACFRRMQCCLHFHGFQGQKYVATCNFLTDLNANRRNQSWHRCANM